MSDSSDESAKNQYKAMEREVIDAFETWHRFHEDLLRLGDFTTWMAQEENQVNLVTFFTLDEENADSYEQALTHQIEFVDNIRTLLNQTKDMLVEYNTRQEDQE